MCLLNLVLQAVSVEDFFDNMRDRFLQSLAFVMGIPLSRFQVRAHIALALIPLQPVVYS